MKVETVLVVHAYSAENAGDGLLVNETLAIVRQAIPGAQIHLIASRPESFEDHDVTLFRANPTLRGWDRQTRRVLKQINDYRLVVAVGGGYLRAGTFREMLKTALVHGPQLRAVARATTPSIYLPQSVGPVRFGLRSVVRRLLAKVDTVLLRDDRSVAEFESASTMRAPDLATLDAAGRRSSGGRVDSIPILSVRAIRGVFPPLFRQLADDIDRYDVYVQSTVGGNDDRPVSAQLSPRTTVSRSALMESPPQRRVVVAVRLHAALMAIAAGHYVIHLAYERKGFGAFGDLSLTPWVHNVNDFDPAAVRAQVDELLRDPEVRDDYDRRLIESSSRMRSEREKLVARVRELGRRQHVT